jgi:hypothetical protein
VSTIVLVDLLADPAALLTLTVTVWMAGLLSDGGVNGEVHAVAAPPSTEHVVEVGEPVVVNEYDGVWLAVDGPGAAVNVTVGGVPPLIIQV